MRLQEILIKLTEQRPSVLACSVEDRVDGAAGSEVLSPVCAVIGCAGAGDGDGVVGVCLRIRGERTLRGAAGGGWEVEVVVVVIV